MTFRFEQQLEGRSGGVVPLRPGKSADAPTSMQLQIMDVSPELAQEFLNSLAPYQRNLDTRHVARLEADMKQGRWVPNGTPIRFDVNGQLCDGQHRLTACVLAGVTLPQQVIVYALSVEANATIDTTMKPRSARQVTITRQKYSVLPSNSSLAAAALEHYNFDVWRVMEGCTAMERSVLWEALTPELQDQTNQLAGFARAKGIGNRGLLAGALRMLKSEGEPAFVFCMQAFSNHPDASLPARVLFNHLLSGRRQKRVELDLVWFVMRAYVAHVRNEHLQVLRSLEKEWPVEQRTVQGVMDRAYTLRKSRP